ncbi:hypothetical protein N8T08_001475 [Aspergillus melleus]|uniref:Uncharacterized protein n=1 Tax=Aspergillus melleus TaxID=138277 RepID=A0ACC3BAA5_9EURO|nr:hypothetical protein N8T08_001475 [Aspergillus melleus]
MPPFISTTVTPAMMTLPILPLLADHAIGPDLHGHPSTNPQHPSMTPVTTMETTSAFAGSDNKTDHRLDLLASHSNVAATIVPIHFLGDDLAADAMTDALPPEDPPVQGTSTKAKASVDDIATAVGVATTTTVTVIVTSAQTKPKTKSKPRSRSKPKAKTKNKPNGRKSIITIALPPLQLASALGAHRTDHLLLLGDVAVVAMIVTMNTIINTTGIVPLARSPHPLPLRVERSHVFTLIGIRCTARPRRLL